MENTIQTIKKQVNENNELVGYLVDGTKLVPLAEGNRDYKEVQEYIVEGGIVEEAYTAKEIISQELLDIECSARTYLSDTDRKMYMDNYIRFTPDERDTYILEREKARETLRYLNG